MEASWRKWSFLALRPGLSGAQSPAQIGFDSKAIIPYNKGASEEQVHGISVPGFQLCFSAVTLSGALLQDLDSNSRMPQPFQEPNQGGTEKTQGENMGFCFSASFLGARKTFPEFLQQIFPSTLTRCIDQNCITGPKPNQSLARRGRLPDCCCSSVTQSCLTLCEPMDCSPPGSSVHEIFQARVLEWVVMPSSRGSSQPRD